MAKPCHKNHESLPSEQRPLIEGMSYQRLEKRETKLGDDRSEQCV